MENEKGKPRRERNDSIKIALEGIVFENMFRTGLVDTITVMNFRVPGRIGG